MISRTAAITARLRVTRRGIQIVLGLLWVGCGLSLAYWVAGQGMGRPWSGLATDPGTAPVLVLLGFAVLGSVPWRRLAGEPDPEPAVLDALGAR